MVGAIEAAGLAVVVLGTLGVALAAWSYWRGTPPAAFWRVARLAQASSLALAALAGIAAVLGRRPDDGLFWVYAVVPVAVGVVAEQLRIAAAETVLAARGLPDARAVGALEPAEQRAVALAVVEREMVVMAAALAAVVFLTVRALATVTGL